MHVVRTTHIQRLIANGLDLAQRAHGVGSDHPEVEMGNPTTQRVLGATTLVPVTEVLAKAAADLRHAAEELEAERLSFLGWAQV
jgi:hypothetical protein